MATSVTAIQALCGLDLTAEERIEYDALLSCPGLLCPNTRIQEHTVTSRAPAQRSGVGKR